MKIDASEDKDNNANDDMRDNNGYVIGGFASHGWSASYNKGGD